MMHSHSRPSFVPLPGDEVDPAQVRLAVSTLAISLLSAATIVAMIVRFL